MTVNYTLCKKF